MFVIAGVTGNTGSVVAETLLAAKKDVRVLVREAKKGESWAARGAEVRTLASLDDEAALTAALEGAAGAYLLLPPNLNATEEERRAMVETIATAIDKSRVQHVVFLSSVGGQHEKGTGPIELLHYAEERLRKTSAKVTLVRAAYFLENWGAVAATVKQGKLATFLPADLTIPMVATRDIGVVAAKALLSGPPPANEVIELAGPRDLSSRDVAALFAKVIGKDVEVEVAPLAAVVPAFASFGVPAPAAELFRQMYEGISNGTVRWERGSARLVRGTVDAEQLLRTLV